MKIVRFYFRCEVFFWVPYRCYDCIMSLNHSWRDLPMSSLRVFYFLIKESKHAYKFITRNHSPAHRDLNKTSQAYNISQPHNSLYVTVILKIFKGKHTFIKYNIGL